jgi:hypothetical protein
MKRAICPVTNIVLDCKDCKAPEIVGRDCPYWETAEHEDKIATFTRDYWLSEDMKEIRKYVTEALNEQKSK